MDIDTAIPTHFHIRWTPDKLDWERFDSQEEADICARKLAYPGGSFSIEEFGDSCAKCRAVRRSTVAAR